MLILFLGTFWESSMDAMGSKQNYERSIWKSIAVFFEQKGMPALGESFWDNSIAWRNKWKNGDPNLGERFLGSSTLFVYLVDGWHVAKALWLFHLFAAYVLYQPVFAYKFFDFVLFLSTFCVGHELFFRMIQYKKKGAE